MKDKAENMGQKIQAKAESAGFKPVPTAGGPGGRNTGGAHEQQRTKKPKNVFIPETRLAMEIAQLFVSLLHGWGLDSDLDKLCINKLGMIRPLRPISFGLLSRGGHMSLLLPGTYKKSHFSFLHQRHEWDNIFIAEEIAEHACSYQKWPA